MYNVTIFASLNRKPIKCGKNMEYLNFAVKNGLCHRLFIPNRIGIAPRAWNITGSNRVANADVFFNRYGTEVV